MMRRSRQTWLALGGLTIGLSLAACPTQTSESVCESLCQGAYICGIIPSALGSQLVDDGAESSIESCTLRCKSSKSSNEEFTEIIKCLEKYVKPPKEPNLCTPTCDEMVKCMQTATSTGKIGAEALGTSQLTITMVPANFWLSTKDNTSWCPKQFGGAPALADIYQNDELPGDVLTALELVRTSYDQLETGLTEAADNPARLTVLDDFATLRYNNEILLPGSLIPRLRAEIEAGGWEASGLIHGSSPGSCIRDEIYWSEQSIFNDESLATLEEVTERLKEEVSGDRSFSVFSNGFDICDRNRDYNDERGAAICEYPLATEPTACRSFVLPPCAIDDCDGGLAGCDPLLCFYQQTPPSRACSELGAEIIFLGYEREGTRYLSEEPLDCDNAVSTVLEDVPIGDVTPIAIVRGSLGIDVPGDERLVCGSTASPPAPAPAQEIRSGQAPSGTQRNVEDVAALDPFDSVAPGDYCWVIYGEPTKAIAGNGDLLVPSPFVEYLNGAIDPGVRLGIMPPQLPVGCGCVLNPANCENHENGNCNDGIDNDGDGATDYYAPECLKPKTATGEEVEFDFPFPPTPNFDSPTHLRACASVNSGGS